MRFKRRRNLLAIVAIGAIAAGGAAYTAGSGFGSVPTASYAGTTVAGAQASNLTFNYSKDGTHILKANFTLTPANGTDNYADESTYEIQAGFGVDASLDGTPGATGLQASTINDPANPISPGSGTNACVPTAVPGSPPATPNTTTVVCSFAPPGIWVSDTNDTTPDNNDASDNPAGTGDSTTNPKPAGSPAGNTYQGADQFNVLVTTIAPTS